MKEPVVGQTVWKLDYDNDPVSAVVAQVGTARTVCIRTYSNKLEVWDTDSCYESEADALVAAASNINHQIQQKMQKSARLFEKLNKLRKEVVKEVIEAAQPLPASVQTAIN